MNEKKGKSDQENVEEDNLEANQENQTDKESNVENDENVENSDQNSIISNLEKNLEELKDEKLRLLADMENLRKRSEKERSDSLKYGSANLAREMLSVGDNLSRALDNFPEDRKDNEHISNLIDGLKMVQKEFFSILEKNGVEKIDALNKKFDHNYHQAMMEIDSEEDEGIVIKEIQTGYIMHNRLLRPTMAGISKKVEKTKEASDDTEKKNEKK
tara:strand:- start:492 stop:1136 length:645 start_codon:yes stop_codon:yes gene_type:complete